VGESAGRDCGSTRDYPGVLSILAFVVSLSTLLILTMPVYRLMQAITSGSGSAPAQVHNPGAKRVEVTVVDRPV